MNLFMSTGLEAFPSDYLNKLGNVLRVICIGHLVLGILLFVGDIGTGLTIMIEGLMLYCSIKSYNVCLVGTYILLAILELVSGIYQIGFVLNLYMDTGMKIGSLYLLAMFKAPLFLISTYYSFLLYKEANAAFIENGINAGLIDIPRNNNNRTQVRSFQGTGYRLDN